MTTPLIWELSPDPDSYAVVLPLTKWIGEETKRNMPPYIYNYYLCQVRESRRKLMVSVIIITPSFNILQIFHRLIAWCYLIKLKKVRVSLERFAVKAFKCMTQHLMQYLL